MEKCRKRPRRLFHLGYALKQVCGDRRSAAIDTRHRMVVSLPLYVWPRVCGERHSAARDTDSCFITAMGDKQSVVTDTMQK